MKLCGTGELKRIKDLDTRKVLENVFANLRNVHTNQTIGTVIKNYFGGSGATTPEGSVVLSAVWPVGSIFLSAVSTNPATLLGFGTWSTFGAGRTLIGVGSSPYDSVESTGGATTANISAHTGCSVVDHETGETGEDDVGLITSGGSGIDVSTVGHTHSLPALSHTVTQPSAHSDISVVQPYITVYMWKRTA